MEAEFLNWLRQRIAISARCVGLSDDAALFRRPDPRDCVLTTDMLMDGVGFELAPIDGGERLKALAVI